MMETQTNPKPMAEYSEVTGSNRSVVTVLAEAAAPDRQSASGRLLPGRIYTLSHRTAGYECAGSAARWTDERWSVHTWIDGARHGQAFKTEAEARACFDNRISYPVDETR